MNKKRALDMAIVVSCITGIALTWFYLENPIEKQINFTVLGVKHYELNGDYKKVHDIYQEKVQYIDDEGDMITLSTNVICRDYLVPNGYKKIDNQTYTVAEEVWDEIKDAEWLEDVSSICKRDVAAKIAYEEFMK